jgi:hypothetical protein
MLTVTLLRQKIWEENGGSLDVNQITMEEFKTLQKDEITLSTSLNITQDIKGSDNVFVGTHQAIWTKSAKIKKWWFNSQSGTGLHWLFLLAKKWIEYINYSPGMSEWVKENNPTIQLNKVIMDNLIKEAFLVDVAQKMNFLKVT